MEIMLFIIIMTAAIGFSYYLHYLDKKRTEFFEAYTQRKNYSFQKENEEIINNYGFDVFQRGSSKRVKRIIQGEKENVKFIVCDYKFQTGSGKSRQTHEQTIMIVDLDFELPSFILRPEGLFDKVAGIIGFSDINFDSHPEFSKAFHLKGENEKLIRNVFLSDILSFYEKNEDIITESCNNSLLFYERNTLLKQEDNEIDNFINKGISIVKLFKEGKI